MVPFPAMTFEQVLNFLDTDPLRQLPNQVGLKTSHREPEWFSPVRKRVRTRYGGRRTYRPFLHHHFVVEDPVQPCLCAPLDAAETNAGNADSVSLF